MTACAILFGLLPIMWSPATAGRRRCDETHRRADDRRHCDLGHSGSSLIYPVIYVLWRKRELGQQTNPETARLSASFSTDEEELPRDFNDFEVAARDSATAYRDGKLWGFIRHARIAEAQASEFWERMAKLVAEFDQLPRSGETVYGFALGVYPTDHPTLPGNGERDAT